MAKKIKLSKADYNALIRNAKFQRNRLFITFFLLIPYFGLLTYLSPKTGTPDHSDLMKVLFGMAIAFPFISYGYCSLRLAMAKCPHCGKQVYMMWLPFFLIYSNPFSRKCLNCGLKMEVVK